MNHLIFFTFLGCILAMAFLYGCATRYDPMPKWHGYELQFKDQPNGK